MTARTTSRTRLIAAVSATAGALALTLLPTTAAQAALPPGLTVPVFSYVDNTTLVPSSGTADAGTTAPLVPDASGYRAYDVDVTPDGNTSVMSLCNGSLAACTDNPAGSRFDATYGVVILHRESVTTTSARLLTNLTSTNPVVSADGLWAMWIYGSTLHIYNTSTETYTTSALAAPKVATEFPTRLAVSADGSHVAVMYRDATGATAGRVLAFPVAATGLAGQTYFEKTYPKTVIAPAKPLRPSPATFTFVGNTNVVYNEVDGTNPQTSTTPRDAVQGTLSLNNATPGTPALAASLLDYYRLRQDAAGNWWAWKDVDDLGHASTTAVTLFNIDDPLAATPAIQSGPTRTDSATTYGYTPSEVAPPALSDTVVPGNPAASHPTFTFSAATVLYNGKSAYQTYSLYGGQPDGLYTTAAAAAETDRGFLQQSFDGKVWSSPGITTSGAKAFVLGTQFYNGYVTTLRRNTYYRWVRPADAFTTEILPVPLRKITVLPIVSATSKAFGTKRIVSGAATRPTGTVYLYRKVGTKYVYVTSTRIVKTATYAGKYAFAARALSRGTYKVVTVADTYAGSGSKVFAI